MNLSKLSSDSGRSKATNPLSLIWIAVAGLAIIVGGILISTVTPLIFPTQGSAEAQQIDALFQFLLAIGGMIFLLVQGVLLYSAIRFRARPGDHADGPPIQGNTTLEFVWTVIPAIIVVIITIYAYQVWVSIQSIKPNEQLVEAVGLRFAWVFNYTVPEEELPADLDREALPANVLASLNNNGFITFSSPQLHTWVGQPVHVRMRTEDVNHAFWIPGMRVKQDLLAGRTTDIRFTPIEPGVYRIVCAELCGSGHGNMAGEVSANGDLIGAWLIVHQDEEAFLREFLIPERDAVLFPPADPALRGRLVINNYACAGCHVLDDLGWVGITGPSLNGIASRTQRLAAGGYSTMEEYIYRSIRYPGEYLVPGYGNIMPAFNPEPGQPNYMPEEDLEAIVAYLLTQE